MKDVLRPDEFKQPGAATHRAIDEQSVNALRLLAVDMVERAQSGHPGMPLGAAAIAYVVWTRFLKHNPRDPNWPDRDRFVLSAGHASALLYSLLHLTGYGLELEDLKQFRQWGSRTPGHPERGDTPGVEATTGPLGQGFANGVGMALAERFLARRFNRPGIKLVDHHVYALVSDGDLMEGVASEAASLAGHLKLGKLIYIYDDNRITIDGPTSLAFTEDVGARFAAFGWHVRKADGLDLSSLTDALQEAREETERPSLIIARTRIGFGSPKEGSEKSHGSPLGAAAVAETKKRLGFPLDRDFFIPPNVLAHFRRAIDIGLVAQSEWKSKKEKLADAQPRAVEEFDRVMTGKLPNGWDSKIPLFNADSRGLATRKASGRVLQALAARVPELVGGSADLAGSNNTWLEGFGDLGMGERNGRNLHFGIREHAMGAIANGMLLHGGVRPFIGTFMVFSDYMRPAIRIAAMTKLPVVYVFTHDSIGLGEDGPTHQPIEHLAALRAIPNLTVIRPCDANETAQAWREALRNNSGPTALCLTRQAVPTLMATTQQPRALSMGVYIIQDPSNPEILLISSGSELHLALAAAKKLAEKQIHARVVSIPSWELAEKQSATTLARIFPRDLPHRLAIEAGVPMGWERWVGAEGKILAIRRFGASAPATVVFEKFGFSVENVVARALSILGKSQGTP